MIFEMTEKQYQLFLHVMQVMQTFYGNNFSSICKEVGDAYGVNDVDIEKAYMIFTDFKVTAPVSIGFFLLVLVEGIEILQMFISVGIHRTEFEKIKYLIIASYTFGFIDNRSFALQANGYSSSY